MRDTVISKSRSSLIALSRGQSARALQCLAKGMPVARLSTDIPRPRGSGTGIALREAPRNFSFRGRNFMTVTENSVETLNRLLRGEIAATETYQQALAKLQDN